MHGLLRVAAALGVAVTCGCALVTHFDLERLAETTEALCSDGNDNDGDGLADCQDFNCLDRDVCCHLPKLLFADDFEGASCTKDPCTVRTGEAAECLSADLWQAWGVPYPFVCEGALVPSKSIQCFEIGVLAKVPLLLRPGLRVRVGIEGDLERKGQLTVGLTQQRQIAGSPDQCAALVPVEHVLAVTEAWTAAGAQLTASFDQRELTASPPLSDGARHELEIAVLADRRVSYLLDGIEFARSPAELPLPEIPREVHVTLGGRSYGARFSDIRAVDESRCDLPGAWSPAATFQTLGRPDDDNAWDSFEVTSPAVLRSSASVIELYYTGCPWLGEGCASRGLGLGLAISRGGGSFARVTVDQPLLLQESFVVSGGTTPRVELAVVDTSRGPGYYVAAGDSVHALQLTADGAALEPVARFAPVLDRGSPGSWDDAAVCCPTVVEGEDGALRLWYAARASADGVWRVGLAWSDDGRLFTKDPHNPVLQEGLVDGFDGRGVTEPVVAYDSLRRIFRMWYAARALYGTATIGYAVSSDGVSWHKFPGNPVLTGEQLGLEDIGRPAVLADQGELRLWLHGREPGMQWRAIYEVQNLGSGAEPAP